MTSTPAPRSKKKPPERLSCIKVRGFRSIRDLDLPLAQLNVLVGANGSGKSNFIGLLNLMSWLVAGNLRQYTALRGDASSVLHYGPKHTPTLDAELHFTGEQGKVLPCYTKPVDGPTIAAQIGLAQLREQCPHFSSWVAVLEKLAPLPPA